MHTYHIIAGLPRSGSTLLSSILSQNPRFKAGIMSPVLGLTHCVQDSWRAGTELSPLIETDKRKRVLQGMMDGYYGHEEPSVIFDSNRGWCGSMNLLDDLLPDAKVICCVRNLSQILDSFEKLHQADPYEQTKLFTPQDAKSIYTRVKSLADINGAVGSSTFNLKEAFYGRFSEKLLIIDYTQLVKFPNLVIEQVYKFIGEDEYEHDFENVGFTSADFDSALGVPSLHTVREKIEYVPRKSLLPPDLLREYSNENFWLDRNDTNATYIE